MKGQFGNIDIYLFDQLLKGRFEPGNKVVDLGCGGGRNLVYFLQRGYDVFGADQNSEVVTTVRMLARRLSPDTPVDNFRVAAIEEQPFEANTFDLVICNAVLHFARDKAHFEAMLHAAWKMLKPGGFFFARLASDIGIEHLVKELGDGRFLQPDGSTRFLVNEEMLLHYTKALGGELAEYIKTTNVQNLRCMTTWCMKKGISSLKF